MTTDAESALDLALSLSERAGKLLLDGYRSGARVHKKGRIDLVTEFDLASEELIRAGIAEAFPTHRIIGEEGEEQGEGDTVWYVDPLDGTTNFAHGHPFFSISIALWSDDAPVLGVVAAPALGVTWAARTGEGTHRNGERCRVSTTATLEDALCATGFPYDRWTNPENNHREFGEFLRRTQGVRRCGSAAIDLALVSDGTYEFYWERALNAWDMCAGALLVTEAGGRLSDLSGGPADPRSGDLVASNGAVHAEGLELLA